MDIGIGDERVIYDVTGQMFDGRMQLYIWLIESPALAGEMDFVSLENLETADGGPTTLMQSMSVMVRYFLCR